MEKDILLVKQSKTVVSETDKDNFNASKDQQLHIN